MEVNGPSQAAGMIGAIGLACPATGQHWAIDALFEDADFLAPRGQPLLLSRLKTGYRFKPDEPERPLVSRVALHAETLSFRHPATGVEFTINAPLPKDLLVAVKYLRRFASKPN